MPIEKVVLEILVFPRTPPKSRAPELSDCDEEAGNRNRHEQEGRAIHPEITE